jgi:hypothetical protein
MKEQPTFYAIIPADVRYDECLTDKAKLLYGEITALTHTSGYCYASNGYFAKLYKTSNRTISRLISDLNKSGYINVVQSLHNADGRKIYVLNNRRVDKNVQGVDKNVQGGTTKLSRGYDKNGYHNNKENKKNNNKESSSSFFQKFWDSYPRKEGKPTALKAFNALSPEKQEKAIKGIEAFCSGKEPKYILSPKRYLEEERWEDEKPAPKKPIVQKRRLTLQERYG